MQKRDREFKRVCDHLVAACSPRVKYFSSQDFESLDLNQSKSMRNNFQGHFEKRGGRLSTPFPDWLRFIIFSTCEVKGLIPAPYSGSFFISQKQKIKLSSQSEQNTLIEFSEYQRGFSSNFRQLIFSYFCVVIRIFRL